MIDFSKMMDADTLKQQYGKRDNLEVRKSLHQKYSTNKMGYADWLFQQYRFFDGCRVLELGCGTGDFWAEKIEFLGVNSSLLLSDLSGEMVRIAAERYAACSNVETMQIDIQSIPFEENRFDRVIANSMLYHVPDLPKAIREVYRVLKPGGVFYASTFGENGITHYLNSALRELDPAPRAAGTAPFTLQNGGALLEGCFTSVERRDYVDSLEVTDANDLIDYVLSMSSAALADGIGRNELFALFESRKSSDGAIHIPKEYGMFVATK